MAAPKKDPLGKNGPLAARMKRLREYHKCTQSNLPAGSGSACRAGTMSKMDMPLV